ncbi:MAG: M16 family metallopeptidase, partial [Spirochaetota bacterium]
MTRTGLGRRARAALLVLSILALILPASCRSTAERDARPSSLDLQAPLPVDPKVTLGTLDNGLTYYIRPNGRPPRRAELRLVVDVGSVLEEEDQRGLAHFLEHMAFNGTQRFNRQELVAYLESIGMRFGPDLNAYTTYDETVYQLQVPTGNREELETGLLILREWAGSLTLDPEEIDQERGVILEEWRQRRGAETRIWERHAEVLFGGSRYANRRPIGDMEVILGFEPRTLERFYRDWYRPDLMAVVAVGDFDPHWMERRIHRLFGDLQAPPDAFPRPVFPVPGNLHTRYSVAADPETTQSRVNLVVRRDVRSQELVDDSRRLLVESLAHQMLNQRLGEAARTEDPPFLEAYSGTGRYVRSAEHTVLGARVTQGEVLRGLEALLTEYRRAAIHGFTGTELERQKRELLSGIDSAYRGRETTVSARYAGEYTRHYLEKEPIPGVAFEHELYHRLVPGITLEEVNRYMREMLPGHSRTVLVSVPDRDGSVPPTEEEVVAVLEAVQETEVEPYLDLDTEQPLLSVLPAGGRVVAESVTEEPLLHRWELSNGVEVVLKPTTFQEDQVLLSAYSPGGHSLAPDELHVPAATAGELVAGSGVGDFTEVQVAKLLAGSTAQATPYIRELYEGIRGSAAPRDLETLFQLVYLYFTSPRLDRSAFDTYRRELTEELAARGASPEAAFWDTVQEALNQWHPRARPWKPEMVERMDPDASLAFYRERFENAGDFTFFLVGRFTPGEIRPLVERYLGGLPSTGREESWRDLGIDLPEGVVREVVRVGLEPKSRVQVVFNGELEWTHRNVFLLSALADVLEIPLRETLREELGGTYSVQVYAVPYQYPDPEYQLHIAFGTSPDKVEQLVDELFSQVRRLRRDGPEEDLLARVREIRKRERETVLEQNS